LKRASGETSILDASALDSAGAPIPRDGDVLAVQQQNYVSIYGEVRHPNRLILTPGLTLLQSIAMAEGLTEWANKKKIQILRKTSDGTEQVTINLNAVESREAPDPPLKPEDVIIVGRRIL
jgi:protein involved in polysaccharide export with SLBB domain